MFILFLTNKFYFIVPSILFYVERVSFNFFDWVYFYQIKAIDDLLSVFSRESNSRIANVHLSVCLLSPKPLSLSELLLSTIKPIDHQAYRPSSLSTIEPSDYWANWPSSLLTIKPIYHWAYQPLSLLTIEPIDHQAYLPLSLSTIDPIDYWAYWPSSLKSCN